jgi:flagellar hook-length control protein FliK
VPGQPDAVAAAPHAAPSDDAPDPARATPPSLPGQSPVDTPAGIAVRPVLAAASSGAPDRLAVRGGDSRGAAIGTAAVLPGAGGGLAPTAAASPSAATAATSDSGTPGTLDQVTTGLTGALAAGQLEVVLRLHPPELGELSVRLQVNGRDVSAWFESALPQVQQALSQGMEQLQTGLANAGFSLNDAWVGADAWKPRGGAGNAPPRMGLAPNAAQAAPLSDGGAVSRPSALAVSLYV